MMTYDSLGFKNKSGGYSIWKCTDSLEYLNNECHNFNIIILNLMYQKK